MDHRGGIADAGHRLRTRSRTGSASRKRIDGFPGPGSGARHLFAGKPGSGQPDPFGPNPVGPSRRRQPSGQHHPPGGSNLDVEARLPINGYWAGPGQEITYDAPSSLGTIGTYEWDLDGDGTFDKTTTSPVLKHAYPATFEGQMILRVSSPLGSTNVLKTPVHIGSVGPWGVRPAPPATVKAEVVSADGTHVKVTWEADDPTADSWAVAVNGVPVGRIEKSARSVTVTDIRRSKDVLLEIFGITADGKVGERAGTTLPAAK